MARILAQAGLRAVDDQGNDATHLAARRRLAPKPWHLWPDNLRTWHLWLQMQTQWMRTGMDGTASGLNYAGVWTVLDHCSSLPRRARATAFETICAMERATLRAWGERAEQQRNKG